MSDFKGTILYVSQEIDFAKELENTLDILLKTIKIGEISRRKKQLEIPMNDNLSKLAENTEELSILNKEIQNFIDTNSKYKNLLIRGYDKKTTQNITLRLFSTIYLTANGNAEFVSNGVVGRKIQPSERKNIENTTTNYLMNLSKYLVNVNQHKTTELQLNREKSKLDNSYVKMEREIKTTRNWILLKFIRNMNSQLNKKRKII